MTAAALTLHQVLLMLALLAAGVICTRLGWFDEGVAQALSKFLLWFVTPALLLDAFNQPFCTDMAYGLLLSGALAVLFHAMAAVLAQLLIRPGRFKQCATARMGAVYSNCGFMAFPLISAVIGTDGVFYGSTFVGVFNLFLWTHGRRLLAGREGFRLKDAVCNAGVLGALAGAALYFLHFQLPGLAADFISTLASLNTPLAMLVIGIFVPPEGPVLPQRHPARIASDGGAAAGFSVPAAVPACSGVAQRRERTAHGRIAVRQLSRCGLYRADDILAGHGFLLRRTPCTAEQPAFRAYHSGDGSSGLLADTIIDKPTCIRYTGCKKPRCATWV